LVAQIVEDIARMEAKPVFLTDPIYPPQEKTALLSHFESVLKERPDLPPAYNLMFKDFKTRLQTDDSRDTRRIATNALLALATPRLSRFMLEFMLLPFYEALGKQEIVAAIREEAMKWN
jgi:hypothetical protein